MANLPILIIDDELSVIEGLTEFLEDEGYEVHHALEGRKGLDVFRHVNPHLVISDLKMPGISGLEFVGEIRKLDKDVPIIIITGYGTLESAIDAIRLDVFDFIKKPIDLDHLKETLNHAREAIKTTEEIKKGMIALQDDLTTLQTEWRDQLAKLAEVEPLIQTGRLLSAILHNLNNPLSYIMGQSELLQALHPDLPNLTVIKEQAVRMQRIISTIVRRVKESHLRESEWLQINDILREEVFFLESHPYFKVHIEKEWQLDGDLPLFRGIAADFMQIFGNILRNAAEALSAQDYKKLWLRSWYSDSHIHVSIRDNGPGIPRHLQDRIFYPFFSTKSSDVTKTGSFGMGIGLYHCRELVHQYGGEIEVQSELGEGAAFVIHLPHSVGESVVKNRD